MMHSGAVLYQKDAGSEDGSVSPGLSQTENSADSIDDDYLHGYNDNQ